MHIIHIALFVYIFFFSYSINFFSETQILSSPKGAKSDYNNNEYEDIQNDMYASLSLMSCLLI